PGQRPRVLSERGVRDRWHAPCKWRRTGGGRAFPRCERASGAGQEKFFMQRIVMPLERFGSPPSDEAEARSPSTSTRHAATETKPEAELRAEPELGRVTSLIEAEVTL